MAQSQSQAIRTFVLGNKELEGKTAEFQYDHGWYSICDIMDEQRNVVYKSKNAQEAYAKWNVYIGRKKERPERRNEGDEQRKDDRPNAKQGRNHREEQGRTHAKDMSDNRGEHKDYNHQKPRRQNRNRRNQNHS